MFSAILINDSDNKEFTYEVIRPVILWGQTPKGRGAETGVSPRTIYYGANPFDQAAMAALLPTANVNLFMPISRMAFQRTRLARERETL